MNVFISLQRLLVRRTNLLGTASNTSLEVTQPVPAPDPTQLLSLNCFVLGRDSSEVFTVKILKTENVSTLKDLIKEKQSPRLNHVVASDLILSSFFLPVDADLEESLKNVDLTPLKPLLPLSQLSPDVNKENYLHIVVQAPTSGEPISVILHVTDDLIYVIQRAWVSKAQEKRRREIRSLLCIKVHVFFLLLPFFMANI